ncbi:hypothetical protein B0H14DRAFT_2637515 [Mycena olivaceomarginata]|nr:hypothetical protein B0H14DRAFT_2637515 [Mycena olivaceomarginata]
MTQNSPGSVLLTSAMLLWFEDANGQESEEDEESVPSTDIGGDSSICLEERIVRDAKGPFARNGIETRAHGRSEWTARERLNILTTTTSHLRLIVSPRLLLSLATPDLVPSHLWCTGGEETIDKDTTLNAYGVIRKPTTTKMSLIFNNIWAATMSSQAVQASHPLQPGPAISSDWSSSLPKSFFRVKVRTAQNATPTASGHLNLEFLLPLKITFASSRLNHCNGKH